MTQEPSRNESSRDQTDARQPNTLIQPGHGPQGVDKAPGEEQSEDNVQFSQQTQKGKQSVDADTDRAEDRSIGKQDL